MKITLDLPAIERLIGNDTEIEVELRNAIVQAFAKKHLKGVITDKIVENIICELNTEMVRMRDEIKKEIHDKFIGQVGYSWSGKFRLTPEGINELKQQFLNELFKDFSLDIRNELRDMKNDEVEKLKTVAIDNEKQMKNHLETSKNAIDFAIDEAVKRRLSLAFGK